MEERGAPNFQKGGRDADVMTFDSSSFKFHTNSDKCHTGDPLLKVVGCPPWAESGTARSQPGAAARRSSQFRGMPVRATGVTPACIAAVCTRA